MGLAIYFNRAYSIKAVKTLAAGFDRPFDSRRTHRPQCIGGFFASARLSAPLWAGYGGEGVSPAGFLERRSVNPAVCPPASFDSGERVNQLVLGGHKMAQTSVPARSEQTPLLFPMAARAARKAARQWYLGAPVQSLAAWRDSCRQDHCHGLPNFDARGAAFDDAFSREIGNLIIGGGRANV